MIAAGPTCFRSSSSTEPMNLVPRPTSYVLRAFVDATEKHAGKNIVFTVAGCPKNGAEANQTIRFLTKNPGTRFYFRRTIALKAYTDDELPQILVRKMKERSLEAEGGLDGIYLRILVVAGERVGLERRTDWTASTANAVIAN